MGYAPQAGSGKRGANVNVVARLCGGVGNQLFQFAMARRLAMAHRAELQFDDGALKRDAKRKFQLAAFAFPAGVPVCTLPDKPANTAWWWPKALAMDELREKHFHFDPDAAAAKPHRSVRVAGYWQSEKYFQDIELQIRDDLRITLPLNAPNSELLEEINRCNAVSVHFRRGDYVTEPHTAANHGSLPLDYYHRAVELLARQQTSLQLFVFTDDPTWAKNNFRPDLPCVFVDINPPDCPAADLRLMSSCRHHVIANSTFSWWGAWLNPRADKMVVAPRRWFNKGSGSTVDLIPPSWRIID